MHGLEINPHDQRIADDQERRVERGENPLAHGTLKDEQHEVKPEEGAQVGHARRLSRIKM